MERGTIKEGDFKRLLLTIFGIFLVFSLVSALVIYERLHVPLSPHYGATISLLTQVKESLIITSIAINLIFWILIAVGITLLGILYSHKIAGPLFRVRKYAATLAEGGFDQRISFREKDALHPLATALNEVAEGYEGREKRFACQLRELQDALLSLGSLSDSSSEKVELLRRLRELDRRIKDCNQELKL
jgi:signal transduction histidine kinase